MTNRVAVFDAVPAIEPGRSEQRPLPPRIVFYSGRDGRRLAARVWQAEDEPCARAVFVHGIISHSRWYEQVAGKLATAGIEVHFVDRRGSGLNADHPGDIDDWQTWLDDVAAYLEIVHTTTSAGSAPQRQPTILCGISWGGKLAPAVARRYASLVDGLALICPGIYSPFMPRLAKRTILAAPAPPRLQQRRLRVPLRQPELFTESEQWREYITQDPLTLRKITWRFAQQDLRLTRFARQSAPFLHLPVLMMLAGQDRIVDNDQTRHYFGQIASPHKTLIEYSNAAHTLEFDPDPNSYFADLTDWITRTAATPHN